MTSRIFERYHVLVVPGWQNSGPEHWQSCWQDAHPTLVAAGKPTGWTPSCADWVLVDAGQGRSTGVVGGVIAWLRHHCPLGGATPGHAARVVAAWLVALADTERADALPGGFARCRAPLLFASQIIVSDNDPYAAARADALAANGAAR